MKTIIKANVVNILAKTITPAEIHIENKKIKSIIPIAEWQNQYALPGFVDAHVHVESSMLVPSEFAKLAVVHGTVATVSDPHEIANVLGVAGVEFMIENAKKVNFNFAFGVPSCVPATNFETAGATLSPKDVDDLFSKHHLKYLAEMMNYPGVLFADKEVMEKIAIAKKHNKVIDGHAPGLRGEDAKKYISAGISTDHECFSADEALDKLNFGMKILIREGSAAKNFEALIPLLSTHYENMMFCSDDKHPDNLLVSHIDELVKRAIAYLRKNNPNATKNDIADDIFKVLQVACINPVKHYSLEVGLLNEGDDADFIVVDNLGNFAIQQTYIKGNLVAEKGKSYINSVDFPILNHFDTDKKQPIDFQVSYSALANGKKQLRVIEALDGELITRTFIANAKIENDLVVADIENDVLKMTVVNRYQKGVKPAVAFIKSFGLKSGAIASSVGHDSHNITAVGTNDEDLCKAVNAVIDCKGGIAVVNGNEILVLPLPVAGIMSDKSGEIVAELYTTLDLAAKKLGSPLKAPFMTLSFMALLVIPALKLSDKGLFDGSKFEFVDLFV
jgi:adenine deaminase